MLVVVLLRVERPDPCGQGGRDRRGAPPLEDAAGVVPGPVLGGLQRVEQGGRRGVGEPGPLDEGPSPGGDAPDPAAGVVAPRVAEVDLAVLDDRVVPVGDVDRAVGPHLDVDRPEGDVRRPDQLGLLARGEAGAVLGEDEPADAVAAEVVREDVPAPVLGQVPAAQDLGAAILRAAGVEPAQDPLGADGGLEVGAGHRVVDPLEPGAVGDERLAPAVEVMPPGVPEPADEDVELHRLGPELPDPPAPQPADAVRRLDVAMDVDRLVEVQVPVVSPPERVEDVVRVLGAEPGEDDAAAVGLAVAVGVAEVEQLGAVGDVGAAVAGLDAGRDEQAVGEDGGPVGAAVAVAVLEDEHPVVGLLAGRDLGIHLGADDPEPSLRIEVHLDRLGQHGVGREQVDLEPLGHLERLPLDLGVRVGDLAQPALGERGRGDRQGQQDRQGDHAAVGSSALLALRGPVRRCGSSACASAAISFSLASTSGSNRGISRAFFPCSCLRKPNRYVSFWGRQR